MGYEKYETTCSFAAPGDKGAFCLANNFAGAYDVSGAYDQMLAHTSLVRYQGIRVPITENPNEDLLLCNRCIMFGVAKAVSHAVSLNRLMHEALSLKYPEIFRSSNFNSATDWGFKPTRSNDWVKGIRRYQGRQGYFSKLRKGAARTRALNKDSPWVHEEGEFLMRWLANDGTKSLLSILIHV